MQAEPAEEYRGARAAVMGAAGLGLIVAAGLVAWTNEGRLDLARMAEAALRISGDGVDPRGEGRLVAVSGRLAVGAPLGDGERLKPGPWVQLVREVEMWAWIERRAGAAERAAGGEAAKSGVVYEQGWTSAPARAGDLVRGAEHENFGMALAKEVLFAPVANVGGYAIRPSEMRLPAARRLALLPEMLGGESVRASSEWLFVGAGRMEAPRLGDLRVRYEVVPAGISVIALGEARGAAVVPAMASGQLPLYRLDEADFASVISTLRREGGATGWLLRVPGVVIFVAGVVLLWVARSVLRGG